LIQKLSYNFIVQDSSGDGGRYTKRVISAEARSMPWAPGEIPQVKRKMLDSFGFVVSEFRREKKKTTHEQVYKQLQFCQTAFCQKKKFCQTALLVFSSKVLSQ
jgi:hypothetical protein